MKKAVLVHNQKNGNDHGFTLFELLITISLISILFLILPNLDQTGLYRISNFDDVQRLVDLLRWAQSRAVLLANKHYLTINPLEKSYIIYVYQVDKIKILKEIKLEKFSSISINRSIAGSENTFYFNSRGAPVFGCTILLQDQWNLWKVIISVASGKIRIDKE